MEVIVSDAWLRLKRHRRKLLPALIRHEPLAPLADRTAVAYTARRITCGEAAVNVAVIALRDEPSVCQRHVKRPAHHAER